MARRYTGRVLIKPERGGYKYIPVKELDKTLWQPVRRKIKVGRAPAKRRRFWVRKEMRRVELVRTFIFRTGEEGVYYGVDVIDVVEVPEDTTPDMLDAMLTDVKRLTDMKRHLYSGAMGPGGAELPGDIIHGQPLDVGKAAKRLPRGTGGWRWAPPGSRLGLRWEDLRRVRT